MDYRNVRWRDYVETEDGELEYDAYVTLEGSVEEGWDIHEFSADPLYPDGFGPSKAELEKMMGSDLEKLAEKAWEQLWK